MKQMKRTMSCFLAVLMLCSLPLAASAQEDFFGAPLFAEQNDPADLRKTDVSGYMHLDLGGGWHPLYSNMGTPYEAEAFSTDGVFDVALTEETIDELIAAAMRLDLDLVADILRDAIWRWLGPIRMDENGACTAGNVSAKPGRGLFDWRLCPIDNAHVLHRHIQQLRADNPGNPALDKFNLHGISGTTPVLLAYIDYYGLDDVASILLDIPMHKGSSLFGEFAKGNVMLNTEILGHASAFGMIGFELSLEGMQPWLRILYEIGLLDVVERLLKLGLNDFLNRLQAEIITPLIFTMPTFWTYVPEEDYEQAKRAQFGGDPKYAGLVAKLDNYHNTIMLRADEIILDAAEHVKVAIRAGYGLPMFPFGGKAAVQSDNTVDTEFASHGATTAPLGRTFPRNYTQAVDHNNGRNYISPDRVVDASTCLLPDQTWFARNKMHGSEYSYSGWYDWWLRETVDPTVWGNPAFPQYVDTIEASTHDNHLRGVYMPLVAEPVNESPLAIALDILLEGGLFLLRIWRWLILLPFFWIQFI